MKRSTLFALLRPGLDHVRECEETGDTQIVVGYVAFSDKHVTYVARPGEVDGPHEGSWTYLNEMRDRKRVAEHICHMRGKRWFMATGCYEADLLRGLVMFGVLSQRDARWAEDHAYRWGAWEAE